MTATDGRRGSEGGFTLVEVLVVVAILGIIGGVLTESIIIGLRTTTATQAQVEGSLDRQRLATAFVPDVQSAATVRLGVGGLDAAETACSTNAPMPASAPPPAFTAPPVVTLSRTDRGIKKVAMYLVADPAAEVPKRLFRRYCEGQLPPVEKVVADDLTKVDPVGCEAVPPATAPRGCTLRVDDGKGVAYEVGASRRAA